MEVSGSTIGIFYISKFLGLAPFSTRSNIKGKLDISRSLLFSTYSAALILIMVCLTYRGLLFDANSKIPVRMKSATSKVVTALDVSVVVMATVAGVFCGILGVTSSRNLNKRLQKIDDWLHSFANVKKDRILAVIVVLLPMSSISILLGLDVWTWLRFVEEISIDNENVDLNVQWYIPFYSLYFILTGLHISFANTAFGLGRRYRRLNLMLRSSCMGAGESKKEPLPKPKITTVKTVIQSSLTLNASLTKAASIDCLYSEGAARKQSVVIRHLAEHHASLGKCVTIVSSSYGIAVLFILVSCLLHLVATAYFLFLEILSKKDSGYLWLQILWIIFHVFRLLLVVEPCHLATNEVSNQVDRKKPWEIATQMWLSLRQLRLSFFLFMTLKSRKSIQIICEIERKNHDPILAEEIKKFWQQLLVSDSEFTAMGLCKVNRKILTSFSSAIATYLVILIQFQKTNG